MATQGMSIHVVDVTRSRAAAGMRVEVFAADGRRIGAATVGARGLVEDPQLALRLDPGAYEIRFHVADYFRAAGTALPARPFLDVVHYRFGIADPDRHYHIPFKTTPWGYSCFLGA